MIDVQNAEERLSDLRKNIIDVVVINYLPLTLLFYS